MKSIGHICIASIVFVILWYFLDQISITMILPAIALTVFPDVDANFNSHRNFITHSVVIWLVVFLFNPTVMTALFLLSVGLHFLTDISPTPTKWIKDYKIRFLHGFMFKSEREIDKKRPKGKKSTIWLLINGLIAVAVFGIYMGFVI